jgi:hypothetical protein
LSSRWYKLDSSVHLAEIRADVPDDRFWLIAVLLFDGPLSTLSGLQAFSKAAAERWEGDNHPRVA